MKKNDIKNLSAAELDKTIADTHEKIRAMRFGHGGTKNVRERGNLRRQIARLETMKTALKK